MVIPFVFYVYGKQGLYFHLATIALAQSRLGKQIIQRKRPVVPQPTPYRYYTCTDICWTLPMPMGTKTVLAPSGDTMSGGTLGGVLIVLMDRGGRFLFQYGSVLEGNFSFATGF